MESSSVVIPRVLEGASSCQRPVQRDADTRNQQVTRLDDQIWYHSRMLIVGLC